MSRAEGHGATIDFGSLKRVPLRVGGELMGPFDIPRLKEEILSIQSGYIGGTIEVLHDPPIFSAGSLLCDEFNQYEITTPPTERQLKRYRRRLRRNKRRADGTSRKKAHRAVKMPRGTYYQQYMRLKTVDQSLESATVTFEVK